MANSADPDQLASSEANWSGFTLFANAGYIRVQQDKGKDFEVLYKYWVWLVLCKRESGLLMDWRQLGAMYVCPTGHFV